jgi:hypothetical protein
MEFLNQNSDKKDAEMSSIPGFRLKFGAHMGV